MNTISPYATYTVQNYLAQQNALSQNALAQYAQQNLLNAIDWTQGAQSPSRGWLGQQFLPTRAERLSEAVAKMGQPFKLDVMAMIDCHTFEPLAELIVWLVKECEWRYAMIDDDQRYTLLIGFEHEADAIKCRLSGFELSEIA